MAIPSVQELNPPRALIFNRKLDDKAGWLDDFKHGRQKSLASGKLQMAGILDETDLITVREKLRKHGVVA